MDKIVGHVYLTNDYSKFKLLEGNRDVTKSRAKKVGKSIREHGYIHNPILVNGNEDSTGLHEVVDGQARFTYLSDNNMPIEYIVFNDLTVDDCRVLNNSQTPWSLLDYIESYAKDGNESYAFLLGLIRKYEYFGINACVCACTGLVSDGNNSRVKRGEFSCTGEQYERADELLGYVTNFHKTTQAFKKGPNNYIYHAIMFAYQVNGVDRKKLIERFNAYYGLGDVPNFIDARSALQVLSNIYNRRNRDKVYFEIEYERSMSKKYTWYAKRHGTGNARIE